MDKYEYQLKLDQLKNLVAVKDYETAAEIADSINWRKVRNSKTLMMVAEVYEALGRYEPCKEVLLQAYDHSSIGRNIVSRLAEVAIKAKNVTEAEEFYSEFLEIAPKDNQRYVIAYKISCLKDAPLTDRIAILEELKEREYTEIWAYELAALYGQAGMREKCVETCDELILWFGDGEYVEKALNLKRSFQPLTPAQEKKYRTFRSRRGMVEISIPKKVEAKISEESGLPEITVTASKFNTQNLQEELAKSMKQIMEATEKETVSDTMDNIKKIVSDIPYLQTDLQEEAVGFDPEKINEEVDERLRSDFQELLAEESDGQISLQIPENTIRDQQIAGQISIEEVLAEWEKTKHAAEAAIAAAEQKRLDLAKEQALTEANEIMERLQALFPVLSADPDELPDSSDTVAAALLSGNEGKQAEKAGKEDDGSIADEMQPAESGQQTQPENQMPEEPAMEETEQMQEADPQEGADAQEAAVAREESELEMETIVRAGAEDGSNQEDELGISADLKAALKRSGESTDDADDMLLESSRKTEESGELLDEDASVSDEGKSVSEEEPDQISTDAEQDPMASATKKMPDLSAYKKTVLPEEEAEQTTKFEEPEEDAQLQKILESATRAMVENSNLEVPVSGGMKTDHPSETVRTDLPEEPVEEEAADAEAVSVEPELENELEEASDEEFSREDSDDVAEKAVSQTEETSDVDVPQSEKEDEPVEDEVWPEEGQEEGQEEDPLPDEAEDMAATDADVAEEPASEEDSWGEPEPEEEPAEPEMAEDGIMTVEERELFSYFLPVPGMEEQILTVLKNAPRDIGRSITSLRGNLIVQGEEGSGKTVLATSLIKAIQRIVGKEDSKIGKISAAALNRRDFAALVPKIQGGFLIVDKAGDLTAQTAARMSHVMEQNTQGMVVILEDDSVGIKHALSLDFSFAKKFTGKVKIPVFTIDELVDFGKSYATEMECVIEEMGVLALYNRINNIKKLDRATTLSEVKDIVDRAIESAESGGLKKLFTKKYDENDYLILREKDFE